MNGYDNKVSVHFILRKNLPDFDDIILYRLTAIPCRQIRIK